MHHPGVAAAVVVGIPDKRLTEMVVACVKVRGNWQWSTSYSDLSNQNREPVLSSEVLRQHCQQRNLTGYTLLRFIQCSSRSALQKNACV